MPAIKQTKYTAEGKAIPPVTHRAILEGAGRRVFLPPIDRTAPPPASGVTLFIDGVKQPPISAPKKKKENPRHG
jgi:hypothetical protein